ncbi:MAG: MFS transporter [Lachnospiraceae bacterium]|nr:MFS transporter [Lachnospiraceae bacterium]
MKKNRNLLISAIAINNMGDIIFDLFIVWGLSSATGQFMNAVYVIGTSVAFRAILSFFVGSFVDKHSKKKMMVISHISSIIIISCFGLLWGLVKRYVAIGLVFVLLNDINNELFSRSYISMTSDIFDENQYIKFQSHSNIVIRIISVGGAALAGTLIEHVSEHTVFIIDIVTYLVSLLLITKVNYKEKVMSNTLSRGIIKTITSDIKYTLMTVWHSSYLLAFIVLMFVLNLAYGYIPQILPVFIANITESATLLGVLKSSMTIGEIVGLALVSKLSQYVSATFKVSMLLNVFIIMAIYFIENPYLLVVCFVLYGFSDSLTQPLFGYTVSNLDNANRGKLLGGIDAIIMFSPSIGIYAISAISTYKEFLGGIILSVIFVIGFLIVSFNKNMQHIVLDSKKI